MAYTYKPFPKWMFHATLAPRLVKNSDEQAALGPDWSETPVPPPDPPIGYIVTVDADGFTVVAGGGLPFKDFAEAGAGVDGSTRIHHVVKHPTLGEITVAYTDVQP